MRRTFVISRNSTGVEADALAELYRREFRSLVAGAFAIVGEPEAAGDVVQEAFARALRQRRRFRGEGTLEAWVWRIVINLARDTARRARTTALSADELVELASVASLEPATTALRAELRLLPNRQRLAVFLHYYADLPYEEVAGLLGVAPGTVAASLHAARTRLRRRIEEAYE